MGVNGLWKILEPTAKPVQLEGLRGKVLAIDASIWIYHFLKAMRDPKGAILAAAHLIGFFRRICKLLFFEIRPVFVFDGLPPILKKQTTTKRSERRQGREQSARATANKLLTIQLQRAAQLQHDAEAEAERNPNAVEVRGSVPEGAVYMDQIDGSAPNTSGGEPESKGFLRLDQYHLPDMGGIAPTRSDDQRMLTQEELDEYSRQFTSQARSGFIDTSLVDFHSETFENLPLETRYQLLSIARLKSRLRMGYSREELSHMFPDQMDFSKFQINRVAQRNFFTQRLMNLIGLEEDLTRRVSSEKNKEYFLKRTEQGWSLSLDNAENTEKEESKKSESRSEDFKEETSSTIASSSESMKEEIQADDFEDEDEFEDVDIQPSQRPVLEKDSGIRERMDRDIDLTAEESSKLDELFGYEATLSRRDLYSKLMEEVAEDEDDSKVRDDPKKIGGSLLFGNAATMPESLSENQMPSSEKPKTAPSIPWFNEGGPRFEEMRMREEASDSHFISREEAINFMDTDDDEKEKAKGEGKGEEEEGGDMKEIDLTKEEIDLTQNEQRSRKPTNTAGSDVLESRHHDRDTLSQIGPDASQIAHRTGPMALDTPVMNNEGQNLNSSDKFEKRQPGNQNHTSDAPPLTQLQHADANIRDDNDGHEVDNEREPKPIDTDGLSSKNAVDGTGTAGEGKGVISMSEEALERAEEEAKADEEADEDIAAMLVAEAEENERFARKLAEQSHKAWTTADQLEYTTQIDTLRHQFSQQTRDSDTITNEMVQECQELLQLFGLPYITAPAEAEAQCAELRELKLVHGVVTDDGDTFLFDSNAVVYRNMFSQAKFVESYTTREITARLGLNRQSLIDLAFLLGSDYTEGILGIGPVTGVEILAEFGDLKHFATWWNEAQRFPDSAEIDTPLKRRLLKQFKDKLFLPEDFPSSAVVDAYLHPAVDTDATKFSWGVPDLEGLRKFMNATAGWSEEKTNAAILPVVQETKRREMQRKTGEMFTQARLDDYYSTVVQNPQLQSKRAAKAASSMRKKAKQ